MSELYTREQGSAIGALLDTFHFSPEARLDAEEAILEVLVHAATVTQRQRDLRAAAAESRR